MESLAPDRIVEWIPYNNLQNVKFLTKGGCSEIYLGEWMEGRCIEWDISKRQLKRFGKMKVILKKLENKRWLNEVRD